MLQKLHQTINTIISPAVIWPDMNDHATMQWGLWLGTDNQSIRKWLLDIPNETKGRIEQQKYLPAGNMAWKSTIDELNEQAHNVHGSSKTAWAEED